MNAETRDELVERVARAMADGDLWLGAWDGTRPLNYRMPTAERNAWRHRARAALAVIDPVVREACAKMLDVEDMPIAAQLVREEEPAIRQPKETPDAG